MFNGCIPKFESAWRKAKESDRQQHDSIKNNCSLIVNKYPVFKKHFQSFYQDCFFYFFSRPYHICGAVGMINCYYLLFNDGPFIQFIRYKMCGSTNYFYASFISL